MKRNIFLLIIFFASGLLYSAPVTKDYARKIAVNYYKYFSSSKNDYPISSEFENTYNGTTAFYVFNFRGGGFVIVSADDAVIPVLAHSSEGKFEQKINNPAVKSWFDNYCEEIKFIIDNNISNSQTKEEWEKIIALSFKKNTEDIQPLLTTKWNQNIYYNEMCPVDSAGPGYHTFAGCLATAMAQILKYHSYPEKGTGSHKYFLGVNDSVYADFGNTFYNWTSMPDSIISSNSAVATLIYHCGVSVDMNYGATGSFSFITTVPYALKNYFNYSNSVEVKAKYDFPNDYAWKNEIINELNSNRPVLYNGTGGSGGHAFVCDGYRSSDDKFHFNWGWSGDYNGYYAIGNLNPSSYNFTVNNLMVTGIKPKFLPPENDDAYKLISNKLDTDSVSKYPLLVYNWLDITDGSGTEVNNLTNDGVKGPFNIGQDFIFFRDNYKINKFYVGDNGYIGFSSSDALSSPFGAMPSTDLPNNFIAPFLTDLFPADSSKLFYRTDTDKFIVTWKDYSSYQKAAPGFSGKITMQAIYYKDGNFKFQYQNYEAFMGITTSDLKIGCEDVSGIIDYTWLNNNNPQLRHDTIFNNGETFLPGLCILGYYTHSHPLFKDVSVEWVSLEDCDKNDNKGNIILKGTKKIKAKISNTGTIDATNINVSAGIKLNDSTAVNSSEELIDSICAGDSKIITLNHDFNFSNLQTYAVKVKQKTPGDIETNNDSLTIEVAVVDSSAVKKQFSWISPPAIFGVPWKYSFSFDTGAVDFLPCKDIFPITIDSVGLWIYRTTDAPDSNLNAYIQLFKIDTNAIIDKINPLTPELAIDLTSLSLKPLNSYEKYFIPVNSIILNDGGIAVKFRLRKGFKLYSDNAIPFSKRNYEIFGNDWTPYRNNKTADNSVYVVWSYNANMDIKEKSFTENILFNVYPNPATDKITIELPQTSKQSTIAIYNISGQEIKKLQAVSHELRVDVSDLSSGIYFIKIVNENGVSIGKFVKTSPLSPP
ncbi:MAG: thiol protease/hemagglutinin PrtT [Bacteroidales bacterium]|nr:thiol protease/hemagglutinin PrtT [Bacteroidales bacterium]